MNVADPRLSPEVPLLVISTSDVEMKEMTRISLFLSLPEQPRMFLEHPQPLPVHPSIPSPRILGGIQHSWLQRRGERGTAGAQLAGMGPALVTAPRTLLAQRRTRSPQGRRNPPPPPPQEAVPIKLP